MRTHTTSSSCVFQSILFKAALLVAVLCLFGCSNSSTDEQSRAIRLPSQKPTASESAVHEGDLYAVVVGVSKYKNPDIPKLKFADKDAKDFADFLDTQKELFRKIHLKRLINEDATRAKVEEQLYYGLSPAGKNDTVILFFAGHGADDLHAPGEFFFLTYDADPARPLSSAVNMNRSGFMTRLDSKRVLLIADTCHSGGYSVQATRGSEPAFERFKRQVSESEGKIILSASKSNEVSIEKSELGNGVFTHFLLKGLRGEADLDGKGVVTLQNLYSYVYQKTKDETKGLQHPQKDGPEVGLFPLALVKGTAKQTMEARLQKLDTPAASTTAQDKPDELAKLRASAEQGNPQAQFELGLKYEYGLGMACDKELALLWYSRAKDKGNKDAEQALARLHKEPSNELGLEIEEIPSAIAEKLRLRGGQGLRVKDIASDAAGSRMGLRAGDMILEVDGKPIATSTDFNQAVAEAEKNKLIRFKILRGSAAIFLAGPFDGPSRTAMSARSTDGWTSSADNVRRQQRTDSQSETNQPDRWVVTKDKRGNCKVISAKDKTPTTIAGPFMTKEEAEVAKRRRCPSMTRQD